MTFGLKHAVGLIAFLAIVLSADGAAAITVAAVTAIALVVFLAVNTVLAGLRR